MKLKSLMTSVLLVASAVSIAAEKNPVIIQDKLLGGIKCVRMGKMEPSKEWLSAKEIYVFPSINKKKIPGEQVLKGNALIMIAERADEQDGGQTRLFNALHTQTAKESNDPERSLLENLIEYKNISLSYHPGQGKYADEYQKNGIAITITSNVLLAGSSDKGKIIQLSYEHVEVSPMMKDGQMVTYPDLEHPGKSKVVMVSTLKAKENYKYKCSREFSVL